MRLGTQMTRQRPEFLKEKPIAHRGLHDGNVSVMENSIEAAERAIAAGYPIELDLQISSDRVPIVFHDYEMKRLTGKPGKARETSFEQLASLAYVAGDNRICSFRDYLKVVDGRVPLVVELKGLHGHDTGFVDAILADLEPYAGSVAIMSFDHHLVRELAEKSMRWPVGLTALGGDDRKAEHKRIFDGASIDFVSYELENIDCAFVSEMRERGLPVISWTVRSAEDQKHSDRHCDQITFEGFTPGL